MLRKERAQPTTKNAHLLNLKIADFKMYLFFAIRFSRFSICRFCVAHQLICMQQWFVSLLFNIWISFAPYAFFFLVFHIIRMKNIANYIIGQSRHFSFNKFLHLLLLLSNPNTLCTRTLSGSGYCCHLVFFLVWRCCCCVAWITYIASIGISVKCWLKCSMLLLLLMQFFPVNPFNHLKYEYYFL